MMNITTSKAKTIKKLFEDFELNEGRTTPKRKITGEDIDLHAEESGDYFPHHMDAEWCKTQTFKRRMAHGTLVLTIAIGLTADVINEVSMTYGFDSIRFVKPVFIDDTIYVVTRIKEKKEFIKKLNCVSWLSEVVDGDWLKKTGDIIKKEQKVVVAIDESTDTAFSLRTKMAKAVKEIVTWEKLRFVGHCYRCIVFAHGQ